MNRVFIEIASLDKLIHEPARLSLMTALASCKSADFLALKRLTGLTAGNLSIHLSKLEEAGLIKLRKQFIEKKPNTQVQITEKGRQLIEDHWQQLEALYRNAQEWLPD
ncbi:MAG: transcriptional regulator [Anaerolineales bacterium]|nr:transcriptional regulator [Anaerolineales bacterium]